MESLYVMVGSFENGDCNGILIWFWSEYKMKDLSYANCLRNDMLNCLYFIKKACVISMFHEIKFIDLRHKA
jgi:hypothetical protein